MTVTNEMAGKGAKVSGMRQGEFEYGRGVGNSEWRFRYVRVVASRFVQVVVQHPKHGLIGRNFLP